MEDNDAQTQLKKRARRRLVGAVFFVSVVALVLPMIMDNDPRQPVPDVEISIPGQDDKAFAPRFAAAPQDDAPAPSAGLNGEKSTVDKPNNDKKPTEKLANEKVINESLPKDKVAPAKPSTPEKPAKPEPAKPEPAKVEPKPVVNDDAKRAAAILAGQAATPAGGEHLVLIGAFANPGNVTILRKKLGEMNIKTFTEPLDTPQGKKTRVRAGPFASREAAEKALEKMKRIGVAGVVAAKP